MKVLATGGTGYIGGRLIPRLLDEGHEVRLLVRDPRRLPPWSSPRLEIAVGDLARPDSLERVCDGIDAAFYLVHSMSTGSDFATRDRAAARNFVAAARGVGRVVYLGGLQPSGAPSSHLESRAEVGRILAAGLPVTEFRAGPIIGSGSASFEMVRYLTERLPIMVTPRWVDNRVQPIAIRDVIEYLVRALERPALGVVDVGGPDRPTFREMMLVYAEARGLRRRIVSVPVLAPGLAARWVGLVTPIPNRLAVPIVEGIVEPLVADTATAQAEFPAIRPLPYRAALERALASVSAGRVRTRWSGSLGGEEVVEWSDREGLARDERTRLVAAPPDRVFAAFARLGGERGWPSLGWAWRLRGAIDKLLGGPGLRRGRRHPTRLAVGEAVDFWRVEDVVPGRALRLRAEMRLPGRAWLEWEAKPSTGGTLLRQTAWFAPRGLAGALYWHLLHPIHGFLFGRLSRALASEAEEEAADEP